MQKITKANIKNLLRDLRQNIFCRGREQDINNYRYFIFINSKVTNIIDQVFPHFEKGFLDRDKVLIIYKHHFESIKYHRKGYKEVWTSRALYNQYERYPFGSKKFYLDIYSQ